MIFLTEIMRNGVPWCGTNIEASSWVEAEKLAPIGVKVVGVLVKEIGITEAEFKAIRESFH